ncbi:uncharacterized protein METZ01_LOCUS174400, partial [marine metagenome]
FNTAVDTLSIGNLQKSTPGYFFDGSISKATVHNRALSAAEVRAAYNGQAVSYEYVGGKQDELVAGTAVDLDWGTDLAGGGDAAADIVAFNAAYGWSAFDIDDIRVASNVLTMTTASTEDGVYRHVGLVAGKKFRLRIKTGAITGCTLQLATYNGSTYVYHADLVASSINEIEFTPAYDSSEATGTNGYIYLWSNAAGTIALDASSTTNSVVQIGCVAEYLPSGINGNTDGTNPSWVDTSGNNLHGTTSTATAVNHEVGALTMVDNIVMANGKGIDFSAMTTPADAAGMTGETLSDYEEGTWLPVLGGSGGTSAQSYTTQDGDYVKIGNAVFCSFYIWMSDKGTITSSLQLQGLPFTSTTAKRSGVTLSYLDHWTTTASHLVTAFVEQGSTVAVFTESELDGDGVVALTTSAIENDTQLMGSLFYLI